MPDVPGLTNMADVKVNKKQLKWIREVRKYTIVQAAGQLGISRKELQTYEAGLKRPIATLFKKMAKLYGVPEAMLLLSKPPRTAQNQLKDFRTRTVAGVVTEIGPETSLAISRVRAYQTKLSDIRNDGFDYMASRLPQVDSQEDACTAGEKERKRLRVPLSEQLSWTGPKEAFRNWRKIIEAQGVCVYMDKFPIDDCRGVSILDDVSFPAILLNKAERAEDVAWIFSLIHEYAHILIGMPGISDRNFEDTTEAYCNQFAAALLMPLENLKKVIKPWPSGETDWSKDQIIELARRFKVSQQAMALRLETIKVAPAGFFNAFRETQYRGKNKTDHGHPPPVRKWLYKLGRRFPTTIISALDAGVISDVEATQTLNANTTLLEKIRVELGV
jgi:Zn-dependent peptidase ImmA (M78 family)/DNA-binding XRE family transcriptional regulator